MTVQMDKDCVREIMTNPRQPEVDVIELQDGSSSRVGDEQLDVLPHIGIPRGFVHVQVSSNPIFLKVVAQHPEGVVLPPIFFDIAVRSIDAIAARRRIEPSPLVERLVIRRTTRTLPKQVPDQCRYSSKPGGDDNRPAAAAHGAGGGLSQVRIWRRSNGAKID